MGRAVRLLPVMLITIAMVGCASKGPEANRTRFQQNVGDASATVSYDLSTRLIRQYGFVVEIEQQSPTIMIQTRWKERPPFGDEQALGVTHAQNRLMITARPRTTTMNMQLWTVDLGIENRVRLMNSETWSDASATPQYERWANQIAEDFKREINTAGIRR
jgi:hypothetical protein